MPISHLLADFTAVSSGESPSYVITEDALEDHRLAAFEKGYAAGWDDAISARKKDQAHVSAALSQSLEDLSFTYHEARTQLMASLEPLFSTLVRSVLPEILMKTLGHRLVEQLGEVSGSEFEQTACLAVAPGESTGLATILPADTTMPVAVTEDPALAPGMAIIKLGAHEREFDSATFNQRLQGIVDAFFHHHDKETRNG